MTLREIRSAVRAKLEGSPALPSRRFYDGEAFDPKPPGDWLKMELLGGPTERIGMTPDGVIERRPLAIVELAVEDGTGDETLSDYEDAIYSLFRAGLPVEGNLRVRSNGTFHNSRRRSGKWLVSSVSVPLVVRV